MVKHCKFISLQQDRHLTVAPRDSYLSHETFTDVSFSLIFESIDNSSTLNINRLQIKGSYAPRAASLRQISVLKLINQLRPKV